MSTQDKTAHATIIPSLRYRNALAAIDWLVTAFGFEKQAVFVAPDNTTVQHAQLTFGNGMIMLGSESNRSDYSKYAPMPDELGGREMRSVSLIVSDCDAAYAQAKAAGTEMVFDLQEKGYGGKAFTCRDPEGYLWNVGTYNPWEIPPPKA